MPRKKKLDLDLTPGLFFIQENVTILTEPPQV